MNRKTKIIIITISIIVLAIVLLLVVGNSFGFFKYLKKGDIVNVITIKGIDVKILNNEDDALNLENAYPISDSEGMLSTPFEFTMTNNSSRALDYSIKVENDTEKQEACKLEDGTTCPVLSTDYIKYSYKKNDGTFSEPKLLSSTNNIISTGELSINETITSSLILWIDNEAGNEIQNHYFFGKLIVTGEQQTVSTFKDTILANNKLITNTPTLTTSSNNTTDESGLYKSTATNSGKPTYYFRGNVENNYVDFAGFTWRIVRINEDGTVRLIMSEGINDNALYAFDSIASSKDNMYYSSSDTAKTTLENWYQTNIVAKGYSANVIKGNYFCEQAKVAYNNTYATNSGVDMSVYTDYKGANFKCEDKTSVKGLVNATIGLLTYDEILHAGGYGYSTNNNYYLYDSDIYWWTMSPAGYTGSYASVWRVLSTGEISNPYVNNTSRLRPVINLKSDTIMTGTGTSTDPYKIKVQETDSLTIGQSVTATDGSKWHVLENSGSDNKYVTLLSDYNLNSDGTYNTTCGLNINSEDACSPMMFDANNTNKYDENDSNNIAYFIKNTYAPLVCVALEGTANVKIPSAWQLASADGKSVIFNNNAFTQITNTWLVTTSYWTVETSSQNLNLVYNIYGDGSRFNHAAPNHPSGFGARPVITTLKTNLIYN